MAVYKILTYPDPFLKTTASPVTIFDDKLREEAGNMIETMYENNGVGLAAIQVGLNKRLFVMDVGYNKENPETRSPQVVINPQIVEHQNEQLGEEGCLSIPDFRAEVKRYAHIKLRYQDLDGKEHTLDANGLRSVCIQHESDHLDGKLFIDYLMPLQRSIIKKKLKKRYA